jgi:hypothetical protein
MHYYCMLYIQPQTRRGEFFCYLLLLLILPLSLTAAQTVHPLQLQLDAGENIVLQPGQVVELTETLKLRTVDQRIETVGAKTASEYARIVHASGGQGTLISAHGIAGATLSKLILDGNRAGFKEPEGLLKMEPMLSFGGEGAVGQVIRHCIVIDSRSAGGWAAIHVQEGGKAIMIEDNVVFAAGADIRGNGRSLMEKPFGWGDGISTASRGTRIINNLIYDATDEGIMLQGAPGSLVKDNVIVAVSREMLGGIALIDPFGYYEMDAEQRTFDYRGIVIEDNLIVAEGSRIHAGFPLGGPSWNARFNGTTLVGAQVRNNHMSGGAAGYGYVVNGVDGFEITGNTSDAMYSGIGDGDVGQAPDAPLAFMYDPAKIGSSALQQEFVPMKESLTGVIRARRSPRDSRNALGYRDQPYPEPEARAVVRMAYIEMVGRTPNEQESSHWIQWLQETRSNADTMRRSLMTSAEFAGIHGYVDPLELHDWRSERWLGLILEICSSYQENGSEWPDAEALNESLFNSLQD